MQIILNQAEVESAVSEHVNAILNLSEDDKIVVSIEDGIATVFINEEVAGAEDTPPVVTEKKTRRRRNPAEAKHVPVAAKEELQTSDGGQSESSMQEAKADQAEGDTAEPTEQPKEEATAQAEAAEPETASEEAAVEEKAQESVLEARTSAKPSLFAGLRR